MKKFILLFVCLLLSLSIACKLGKSDDDTPPTQTVIKPSAPTNLTKVEAYKQVTITWQAVTNATSYNIYWDTTHGVNKTNGTKISALTNTSYTHEGLTNNIAYYYVVTTLNANGESVESAEISATPKQPISSIPTTPLNVLAVPADTLVTIGWKAVESATSYNIYWSKLQGVNTLNGTLISNIKSTSYVHSGLTNATAYYYIVVAINSNGNSDPSPEVSAIPQKLISTIPAKPTNVIATPGNKQVTVNWNIVEGATSYNLYYLIGNTVNLQSGIKITGITPNYKIITGLSNNSQYAFAVTAVNAIGQSALSSTALAKPVLLPPNQPTITSIIIGDGSILLGWDTKILNAVSYNIYYSQGDTVSKLSDKIEKVKTSPYKMTPLINDTTYTFAVTAFNIENEESELIASVSATPTKTGWFFGGDKNDVGNHVELISDGYLIVGSTNSYGAGGQDIYFAKTDISGAVLWKKTFGTSGYDETGSSLIKASDGNYVIIGSTSDIREEKSIYLIKTDSSGNTIWEKSFNGNKGMGIKESADGGYVLLGESNIIKVDKDGIVLWENQIAISSKSMEKTSDNGYIITGSIVSVIDGTTDLSFMKVDADGYKEWDSSYSYSNSSSSYDQGNSAIEVSDGNFLAIGTTKESSNPNSSAYMIKIDKDKNRIWETIFTASGADVYPNKIIETQDKGFLIVGTLETNSSKDIYIIKTDKNGIKLWSKKIGGTEDEEGYDIKPISSNRFVITGSTSSYGALNTDVSLFIIDENGAIQ